MLEICWFSTGRDEEALMLLDQAIQAVKSKKINGKISLCFLNRELGESYHSDKLIELAKKGGIPVETLSTKRFLSEKGLSLNEGRKLFDEEVLKRIERYRFDLIFLAGYMLIVSDTLFDRYTVLNLHPSLPGKYKGKWEDVITKIIENGEKSFGAMIHIVTDRLDEGPTVAYCKVSVSGDEIDSLYEKAQKGDKLSFHKLFRLIREKEFSLETPLIMETLSAISYGKIKIMGKKVFFENQELVNGVDLTHTILKNGMGL
ncbi:MAG: formyltransferase family protein [Deltaproteobacteria bacterium]|nr:formyltransferase family protein [Deltaproteobacteria bacterium]